LEHKHDPGIHADDGLEDFTSLQGGCFTLAASCLPVHTYMLGICIRSNPGIRIAARINPRSREIASLPSAASRRIRSFEIESAHL